MLLQKKPPLRLTIRPIRLIRPISPLVNPANG